MGTLRTHHLGRALRGRVAHGTGAPATKIADPLGLDGCNDPRRSAGIYLNTDADCAARTPAHAPSDDLGEHPARCADEVAGTHLVRFEDRLLRRHDALERGDCEAVAAAVDIDDTGRCDQRCPCPLAAARLADAAYRLTLRRNYIQHRPGGGGTPAPDDCDTAVGARQSSSAAATHSCP